MSTLAVVRGAIARGVGWMVAIAAITACGQGASDSDPIVPFTPTAVLLARQPDAVEWIHPSGSTDAPSLGSFSDGGTTRFGLRLPARTGAIWPVVVPAGAELSFAASTSAPSTGSELVVELSQDRQAFTEVLRVAPRPGNWPTTRVNLAEDAERTQWIRFRVLADPKLPDAGGEGTDVLIAEPAIYVPSHTPRRVLLVFVDTLRPDHLGLYGYARDTSPGLDAFARSAAVFESAHAPSPWTLPSARAALSGRHPEHWDRGQNLAERLAATGFATLGTVSNAFLGAAFRMARGWSEYEVHPKSSAAAVVDRSLALLASHEDRDVLLLAHFMDPHLPYQEPPEYRHLFSDGATQGDEEYLRVDLMKIDPRAPNFEQRRRKVVDRYDQTIRYLDDELLRLFEGVGPEATIVFFSDHGEEFWDHGGVEHGHTLFEELLRVPLLVRDRRLSPGRYDMPVTLLDVAPTLLTLLGQDVAGFDGRSLTTATRDNRSTRAEWNARPNALGYTLYGGDGWGVRVGDRKWISRGGRQLLYDLADDPEEALDLAANEVAGLGQYPAALEEGLGRPVKRVWRVVLRAPEDDTLRFQLTHPTGIERGWITDDPREEGGFAPVRLVNGSVRLEKAAGDRVPRAFYLVPAGDPDDVRGLWARLDTRVGTFEAGPAATPVQFMGGSVAPLLRAGDVQRGFLVLHAHAPLPTEARPAQLTEDVRKALEALGYLE